MKAKYFLLSLLMVLSFNLSAQDMTFLRLPLKGTIDQFTKKLEQKGYYVSPFSKDLPVGQRGFEGRWGNDDVFLIITYSKENKRVYDAILNFFSEDPSDLEPKFDLFKEQLGEKFKKQGASVYREYDEFSGFPMWRFFYKDSNSDLIGKIYLYYTYFPDPDNRDITIYNLQVRYRNNEAPSFLEEYGDQMF